MTPAPSAKAGARAAKCVRLEAAKLVAIRCTVTKTEYVISDVSMQAKFGVRVENGADLFQTILNLDSLPLKGREKIARNQGEREYTKAPSSMPRSGLQPEETVLSPDILAPNSLVLCSSGFLCLPNWASSSLGAKISCDCRVPHRALHKGMC